MADENTITFKSENIKTFTERNFQPIIPTFCTILDRQELQPLDSLEGKSISKLFSGIELPFMKGFFNRFAAVEYNLELGLIRKTSHNIGCNHKL